MPNNRKQTRHVPEKHLEIFDVDSNRYIGLLANFSTDGIMLVTTEKIKSSTVLQCRVKLPQDILNHNEIIFEAFQCWSRKNIIKDWWESGFKIKASKINKELLSYLSIAFVVGKWNIPGVRDVNTAPAENLRKTTRYEVKDRYSVCQQFSYHEIGKLANLSITGASFLTQKPVEKGTLLNCKVKLPKTIFQQDFLFFDAECRWCKKDGDTRKYISGYKLHNVSEHDKVILLHLLLYYLEEQNTEQRICVVRTPEPKPD